MKKAFGWSIAVICALSIVLMLGIFIGRRSISPPTNDDRHLLSVADKQEDQQQEKININTADVSRLKQLPGIGEVLAERIVDYRNTYGPFKDVRELAKVSGIGDGKLTNILHLICVEDN